MKSWVLRIILAVLIFVGIAGIVSSALKISEPGWDNEYDSTDNSSSSTNDKPDFWFEDDKIIF